MEKVTGIGGVFFKADNPTELGKWYRENLGVPVEDDGSTMFHWREAEEPERNRSDGLVLVSQSDTLLRSQPSLLHD